METNDIRYFTISLRVPEQMYGYLKDKAMRECTSTSYLIRKMILEEMNREERK